MLLEEWEKHIGERNKLALCGEQIGPLEWAFVDSEHAILAAQNGGRLQPCPACLAALMEGEGKQ